MKREYTILVCQRCYKPLPNDTLDYCVFRVTYPTSQGDLKIDRYYCKQCCDIYNARNN